MPVIVKHGIRHDWCHICGVRSNHTADIWYPTNAEHATVEEHRGQAGSKSRYIRICSYCAEQIQLAAGMDED